MITQLCSNPYVCGMCGPAGPVPRPQNRPASSSLRSYPLVSWSASPSVLAQDLAATSLLSGVLVSLSCSATSLSGGLVCLGCTEAAPRPARKLGAEMCLKTPRVEVPGRGGTEEGGEAWRGSGGPGISPPRCSEMHTPGEQPFHGWGAATEFPRVWPLGCWIAMDTAGMHKAGPTASRRWTPGWQDQVLGLWGPGPL